MRNSSMSALSDHCLQPLDQDVPHRPQMKDTQILACEKNTLKRKILESICIENKRSHLCNTGVSVELPLVWNLCAREVTKELAYSN